jgi:hypothetical protein
LDWCVASFGPLQWSFSPGTDIFFLGSLDLLWKNLVIPLRPSSRGAWRHFSLNNLASQFVYLAGTLRSDDREGRRAAVRPFVRISGGYLREEDKYWIDHRSFYIHAHGPHDYYSSVHVRVDDPVDVFSSVETVNVEGSGKGFSGKQVPKLVLSLYLDPQLEHTLEIQLDWMGFFVQVLKRYGISLIVFCLFIQILCLRAGIAAYRTTHRFPSPWELLRRQIASIPFYIFVLWLYSLVHAFSKKALFAVLEYDTLPVLRWSVICEHVSFSWFTGPGFSPSYQIPLFFMAFGFLLLYYALIYGIVYTGAAIRLALCRFPFFRPPAPSPALSLSSSPSPLTISVPLRSYSGVCLFVIICLVSPYQYSFAIAFAVHMLSTTTALFQVLSVDRDPPSGPSSSSSSSSSASFSSPSSSRRAQLVSLYHLHMSILLWMAMLFSILAPSLFVWLKNLAVLWVCFSDHRFGIVLPATIFVWLLKQPVLHPSILRLISTESVLLRWSLTGLAYFTVLYGMQFTYALYLASNFVMGLLALAIILQGALSKRDNQEEASRA